MRTTREFTCLLISPSDVVDERRALAEVVTDWNAQIGRALTARIELVRWESHATPDLSARPQDVLNRQLLPSCDLAIALFWTRLGTPTTNYSSGSVEEIRGLLTAGCRVLVYFCQRSVPQERLVDDQYRQLQVLRSELEASGLVGYYEGIPDLREQVLLHVTRVVTTLLLGRNTERAKEIRFLVVATVANAKNIGQSFQMRTELAGDDNVSELIRQAKLRLAIERAREGAEMSVQIQGISDPEIFDWSLRALACDVPLWTIRPFRIVIAVFDSQPELSSKRVAAHAKASLVQSAVLDEFRC